VLLSAAQLLLVLEIRAFISEASRRIFTQFGLHEQVCLTLPCWDLLKALQQLLELSEVEIKSHIRSGSLRGLCYEALLLELTLGICLQLVELESFTSLGRWHGRRDQLRKAVA
jgi:hypothetical protein